MLEADHVVPRCLGSRGLPRRIRVDASGHVQALAVGHALSGLPPQARRLHLVPSPSQTLISPDWLFQRPPPPWLLQM